MAARVSLRASLPSLYRKQETKRSCRFRVPTAVGAWWDALVVTSQQPRESVADELYRPSRVVDRDQRSWMLTRDPDGNDVYTAGMHRSYLTLGQVRLQHGPIRPIVPITDADRQALFNLLAAAKRKAVY